MKRSFPFADNSTVQTSAKQKKVVDSSIYDMMVNRMDSDCYIDLLKEVQSDPTLMNNSAFQCRFIKAYATLSNEAKIVSQPLIQSRNNGILYRGLDDTKLIEMKRVSGDQFSRFLPKLIPMMFTSAELLDITREGAKGMVVLNTIIAKHWNELDSEYSFTTTQSALRKQKNELARSHYNVLKNYPFSLQTPYGVFPCMEDADHHYKFKRNNFWFPVSRFVNANVFVLGKQQGVLPKLYKLELPSFKETFLFEKRCNAKTP